MANIHPFQPCRPTCNLPYPVTHTLYHRSTINLPYPVTLHYHRSTINLLYPVTLHSIIAPPSTCPALPYPVTLHSTINLPCPTLPCHPTLHQQPALPCHPTLHHQPASCPTYPVTLHSTTTCPALPYPVTLHSTINLPYPYPCHPTLHHQPAHSHPCHPTLHHRSTINLPCPTLTLSPYPVTPHSTINSAAPPYPVTPTLHHQPGPTLPCHPTLHHQPAPPYPVTYTLSSLHHQPPLPYPTLSPLHSTINLPLPYPTLSPTLHHQPAPSLLPTSPQHPSSRDLMDQSPVVDKSRNPPGQNPRKFGPCNLNHRPHYFQVWFQNRRAKYRKQEKQLQKALAGTPSVLPTCNGAMMRNMYPTATRGYQPYPSHNAISTFNTMNRYPQVSLRSPIDVIKLIPRNGTALQYDAPDFQHGRHASGFHEYGDGGRLVQEGAGLALLLGAADGRRRGLVQEVPHSALHEHHAPPKLVGAHASVPNLDVHLRSLAAAGGPAHQSSSAAAAAAAAYPSYYSSYYHYYYGYSAGEALQGPSTAVNTEHGLRHASNHTTASAVTSATAPAYGHPSYSLEGDHTASEYEAHSGSSSNSSTTNNIRRPGDTGSEFPTSPAPAQLQDYGSLMGGGCNLSSQDSAPGGAKTPVVYPPPLLPPHSHAGLSYTPVSEAYGQMEGDFNHASLAGYEASNRPLHEFASHDHLHQQDSSHDQDPVSDPEGEQLLHEAP
ncbi:hypothetical protein Hamer_G009615 [Homarus americanus]|uniref:Homeobox domain-containing protein n=1 Tax=Homarus americanus TaxID=6706 RepID=A0A8J5T2X8_HOMAM|nr:hypothetical protein Hamer_G009615 [Homarus americanus]